MALQDINKMIGEYQEGCDRLENRIAQLDREISQTDNQSLASRLAQRRLALSFELWDMLCGLGSLKEYRESLCSREKGGEAYGLSAS